MVQQWTYDCFIHGKENEIIGFNFWKIFFVGDVCRIFDILLITLLHSDTIRIKIQRLDPVHEQESFLDSKDQILMNTDFNNETDDINEITFSLAFDDGNNEDYDDGYTYENETEQEEAEEEKRVRFYCLLY